MFTEGMFIENNDADIKRNSRSEFRQPTIPRIVTTREPPAGEGGEGRGRRGGGTGRGTCRGVSQRGDNRVEPGPRVEKLFSNKIRKILGF